MLLFTKEQVETFQKQGYILLRQFYTLEHCALLKKEIQSVIRDSVNSGESGSIFDASVEDGKQNADKYFMESGDKIRLFYEDCDSSQIGKEKPLNKIGHALHYLNDTFRTYSLDYTVTEFILKTLGYIKPAICQSMYIFKREKVGGAVRPHTDGTFLINSGPVVGFWIPLEDATVDNGCLWFIPGSHKKEIKSFYERTAESNYQVMALRNSQEYDDDDFVPVEANAGDLVLIDKAVVHKSEKNTSDKPRDAFTFHVIETYDSDWSKLNWLQPTESEASFPVIYDSSQKEEKVAPIPQLVLTGY